MIFIIALKSSRENLSYTLDFWAKWIKNIFFPHFDEGPWSFTPVCPIWHIPQLPLAMNAAWLRLTATEEERDRKRERGTKEEKKWRVSVLTLTNVGPIPKGVSDSHDLVSQSLFAYKLIHWLYTPGRRSTRQYYWNLLTCKAGAPNKIMPPRCTYKKSHPSMCGPPKMQCGLK